MDWKDSLICKYPSKEADAADQVLGLIRKSRNLVGSGAAVASAAASLAN